LAAPAEGDAAATGVAEGDAAGVAEAIGAFVLTLLVGAFVAQPAADRSSAKANGSSAKADPDCLNLACEIIFIPSRLLN
jgi:hypothetical protein